MQLQIVFQLHFDTDLLSMTLIAFVYFIGFYRPRKLGHSFPRLYDIVEGEAIAALFLQLNPEERMGAEDALNHPYFAPLPRKLFELPDGKLLLFEKLKKKKAFRIFSN